MNEFWLWNHCNRFANTSIMNLPEGNVDNSHKLMPGIQLHLYNCVCVCVGVHVPYWDRGKQWSPLSRSYTMLVTTIGALTLRLSVPSLEQDKSNLCQCQTLQSCLGLVSWYFTTSLQDLHNGATATAARGEGQDRQWGGANENNGKGFWWQDKQAVYKEYAGSTWTYNTKQLV